MNNRESVIKRRNVFIAEMKDDTSVFVSMVLLAMDIKTVMKKVSYVLMKGQRGSMLMEKTGNASYKI